MPSAVSAASREPVNWPARSLIRRPPAMSSTRSACRGRRWPSPCCWQRAPPWPPPPGRAGLALLAAGLGCLASAGGRDASLHHGTGVLLLPGIVATSAGGLILAPLGAAVPAAVARQAPVTVRLALGDLGRYRARTGAALAAATFAVFLAVLTCILASARFGDPLRYTGPNLAPTPAQQHALEAKVNALAASFHARFVLPLDSARQPNPGPVSLTVSVNQAATLWQATSTGTGLPTGTSAPNTVITEHAARALGLTLVPDGWLIQATGVITPAQQDAARQLALAAQSFVETDSARMSQRPSAHGGQTSRRLRSSWPRVTPRPCCAPGEPRQIGAEVSLPFT